MPERKSNVMGTMAAVTVIAAISKILGLVRETVIASVFGAGAVTDAYAVAARIVGTAGLLVAVYLTTTFVPAYARVMEEHGEEGALRYTNGVAGLSLIINIALMAVLQAAAPLALKITGFGAEQSSFALTAVRISLFQLPLNVFVSLFTGYLTARKSFWGPNMVGIPLSAAVITVCFVMGPESGITGLALANLLGVAAQVLLFLAWLPKEKYRYRFSVKFNTPEIRKSLVLLIPALLGSAVSDLNVWVDTIIATHLAVGSTAAIGFSSRIIIALNGLIIMPIAGITYAYMSGYAAKKETGKMLDSLWKTMLLILFVIIPVIAISVPSSKDIISIAYQRGSFTAEDTLLTSSAFLWYLPGILGTAAHILLLRFFYVLQDTKTPMFCGIASVSVNIALSLTLSRSMGIAGVALATSVGNALSALFLLIALRRKVGPLGFGKAAVDIGKMLFSAVPCVLAVIGAGYLTRGYIPLIRFAVGAAAGFAAYIIPAFLLKETALMDLTGVIRQKFRRGKN